jgi:TolB protein
MSQGKRNLMFLSILAATIVLFLSRPAFSQKNKIGIFNGSGDIGKVLHPGSVKYNSVEKSYTITGSGENMWFTKDAFFYVWKKVTGDATIEATVKWIGTGVNPHRKACLVIRQSLEPGSEYADAARHGDGLTSLQYREEKNGLTREIQSNESGPTRLRIEKEGDFVSMSIAKGDEPLHPAGGSFKLVLKDPFYIGIGVSSHDSTLSETAVFSDIKITKGGKKSAEAKPVLESTLETIAIESKDRRVAYHTAGLIEAPNWSRDGKYFLFNREGKIYKLPVGGKEPQLINTGFAVKCNNDHGISPDGKLIAVSDQSKEGGSRIYTLPIDGGDPQLLTTGAPSYWHGWSPDGSTIAYCAERNGEFDVYSVPAVGGAEKRLTTAKGLDDGPDYSSDGKYIYFNSDRTGTMQIYRMNNDGSDQQQITSDEYNNWFPHPSPDGKWIVFLSYQKEVKGHPANKDVMLRLIPAKGGDIQVLAKLFGGQGTINVPSWSPDGANLSFVSYRELNQ